ncbi:hypothetical protein IIB79_06210 [candidate division KSB1 bacterium]|nr:hypothetical protein [candidate division KSB1 bacterium]
MKHKEIDLNQVKTIPISTRKSKISTKEMAKLYKSGSSFKEFLESLPPVLKADDLKEVAEPIVNASKKGKPVVWMMGAHVIKRGLSPIIIDLMENKIITMICMNGAGAIHDLELACFGHTSEDVAENLLDGSFGMSHETAETLNKALSDGEKEGLGYGSAIGKRLAENDVKNRAISIFAAGYRLDIPVMVFVGIGTEITHQHPSANGAVIGELSMRDFRIFSNGLCNLGKDGIVLNVGSAVILPEVFLKALTVARNLGHPAEGFSAVNFDMIQHYRPVENVISRPTLGGGKGYKITGHHEIMIPLLVAAVKEAL